MHALLHYCLNLTKISLATAALLSSSSGMLQVTEPIRGTNGTANGTTIPFDQPFSLAVDGNGNAYVGSLFSSNILKLTPQGVLSEFVRVGQTPGTGVVPNGVFDIAADELGNVYFGTWAGSQAFKVDPNGLVSLLIDSTGDGAGHALDGPVCIAVGPSGNVYASGIASNNVFRITPTGTVTQIVGEDGDGGGNRLLDPSDIAVDGAGNVYVVGLASNNVFRACPAGSIAQILDADGDGNGNGLLTPLGIAADDAGNAYVVGSCSDNVFRITPAGVVTEIIGPSGDGAGTELQLPLHIALGNEGDLYVTNRYSILKLQNDGEITVVLDVSPMAPDWLIFHPRALAITGEERIYTVTGGGVFQVDSFAFFDLCNGDGGNQFGCTNCPCGNDTQPGTTGGCINSAGTSARLLASGDKSVSLGASMTTDLRFALSGAPANSLCILNSGNALAPGNAAHPCFGQDSGIRSAVYDGLRCAIMNTRRHGGRVADPLGNVGLTGNPWGGEGNPPGGIASAGSGFATGQTRFFQVIHRDNPLSVCQRGLNTSQAIGVTFIP